MPSSPKVIEHKIELLVAGWDKLASGASFAGMTQAKFKAAVQPSLDIRAEIADLESQLAIALQKRGTVDQTSNAAIQLAVNAVKGDPNHGEDSALYGAIGYVRKSERKTGAARKKAAVNAVAGVPA